MNARELKTIVMRRRILRVIREKFDGVGESERAIATAVNACNGSTSVSNNLNWLVENGYLTLERSGWKKAYTLTEKVA